MRMTRLWPIVALAAVALIPTGKFIFGGLTPAPVDQVHQLPPWNGRKPDTPWDILQLDGALQFLPWRDYMLASMEDGEAPLWNPYTLGGVPFLANSQTAPLYPLHWLLAPLGIGAEWLMSLSAWLHLFIAGLGVYLLCIRLGGSAFGGLIGGTAITLSAFMVSWIQLPSVIMTASWIPWCLLGVLRLCDDPSAKSVAKLAAPVGMMLLAGHLQIAGYGLMATVLYALWIIGFRRAWMRLGLVAFGALALGFLLASPQLLPAIEAGRNGHRSAPPTAAGWEGHQGQALAPYHLAVFVTPTIFGMPNQAHPLALPGETSYWLAYEETGRHYAELAFYVGPIVLALGLIALAGFWRKPEISFFGVLFLFGLLVALGTIVAKALYYGIPGWSATGSPGRAAILVSVALCVLAGVAFRRSKEKSINVRAIRVGLIALILAFSGALIAMLFLPSGTETSELYAAAIKELYAAALKENYPLIALFVLGAVLVYGGMATGRSHHLIAAVLLLFQIITLSILHLSMNPGSERGQYRESFAGLDVLQKLGSTRIAVVNDQWPLLAPGETTVAPPNSLLPYRIREIGGYDSIIPKRRKEQLDAINGQDSAPLANGNMMFIKPGFDPDELKAEGVEYLLSGSKLPYETVYESEGWALYQIPGKNTRTLVIEETAAKKKIANTGPEAEALAESLKSEGWTKVASDAESITFVYNPRLYTLGILLGLLGICGMVALSCMRIRENRSDGRADTA